MRILNTFAFGVALLTATPALAAEQGLTSTFFPNKSKVVIPMSPTERAPAVKLKVLVKHKGDLTNIKIKYKDLLPATLFGGDIVTYVVWAVSPDGSVQNLGSLGMDGKTRGKHKLATPWRDFAMMITAEPIKSVTSPGEHVIFYSGASPNKRVTPQAFTFDDFADRSDLITIEKDSIADLTYKRSRKNPVWLVQAEKATELLTRFKAKEANAGSYEEAMAAVKVAKSTRGRKQLEASIRTIELSGQTLKALGRLVEERKATAVKAGLTDAEAAAAAAAAEAGMSAAALSETEGALSETEGALQVTKARLAQAERDRTQLERQKQAVESQLENALGSLAKGRATEEGYVISLSGGAFASGKSRLTTQAKYVVAKLSGMVLAFPDMSLRIEGHTDNTGNASKNMKLSVARAKSVETFLAENGMESSRMESAGYGGDKPATTNDTKEGRDKNRRVDIVLVQPKNTGKATKAPKASK